MASISKDSNGAKRILFYIGGIHGDRHTIRLGKTSLKNAQSFRVKIEALVKAKDMGVEIDHETTRWAADLPDATYAKLAKAGLVAKRIGKTDTLAGLVERFVSQADVTKPTLDAYRQTTNSLLDFFGGDLLVSVLTPSDADEWRASLVESKLAKATVAKRCHVAKNIMNKAVRWSMIDRSPFADLRTGSQTNESRNIYIDREIIAKVVDACPSTHWRLVVALARYAGLRTPSEPLGLTWGDVNWDRGRMIVHSPKTQRHEGHGSRVVPIVPELMAILMDAFEQAQEGEDRVLPRLTNSTANLRTTMFKIINRAGETPWPRLFQNLRASCATDWTATFPNRDVASWMGHSPMIAAQHYLKPMDANMDAAAGLSQGGALSVAVNAQKASQHTAAPQCASLNESAETLENKGKTQDISMACVGAHNSLMGGEGFEPPKA